VRPVTWCVYAHPPEAPERPHTAKPEASRDAAFKATVRLEVCPVLEIVLTVKVHAQAS